VVACEPTWKNRRTYQTVTNNACQNINAELLLVSRLEYAVRIVLSPLVVVVKIYEGESVSRLQVDVKRKTCDIRTWKKTFISRHILRQH
jgi:hypothetical protein